MKLVKGIYFPDSDTHFETIMDNDGNYQGLQFETALKYIKLEDRGLFIDVGAHVGLWSRMAYKASFKEFICFEPDEENFECLRRNFFEFWQKERYCSLSKDSPKYDSDTIKRRLHQIALSDQNCWKGIIKEKEDNSGAISLEDLNYNQKTRVVNFDDYYQSLEVGGIKNKILIKIDVQGYEAKVVRGMKKFIQEYKPIIIVEQFINGQPDYEATMILKSYGMKVLEAVKKEVILGW